MTRSYLKPSLTIFQQIEHLRQCGMEIGDESVARFWLSHVSYYRLSAYWLYFERPKTAGEPRFKAGTTLKKATDLYDFDRNLRRIVFRGTEHVEVALKGSWAYQLGQIEDGHSYLNAGLYRNRAEFHKSLAKLANGVGRSRETYIKHYLENYDTPALPPVWMVAEMMSFGELSRWYSNLRDRALRNRIAQPLGLTETVFVPLVRHINDIRNTCAHHGRLWNRGFRAPPRLAEKPENLAASLDRNANQAGLRLYNGLTMINFIVGKVAPDSNWSSEVKTLLQGHPQNALNEMGFPTEWDDTPIWQD